MSVSIASFLVCEKKLRYAGIMHTYITSLKNTLLDYFFPLSCLGCGQESMLLCDTCFERITPLYEQSCPFCRRHITPHGETCFSCCSKHALDGLFVGYPYEVPLIHKTLHAFKYQSIESLSFPLGTLLMRAVKSTDIALPDLVLPVPLHPWRLRYRGFNQSELLGKSLADTLLPNISIPFETVALIRTRFTLPQQKMPGIEARKHNIKNAFIVPTSSRKHIKGKSVWLVDDVATTGSTLEACAKALKKAGARKVFGVALARNTLSHHTK